MRFLDRASRLEVGAVRPGSTIDEAEEAHRRERAKFQRAQLSALIQRADWPELDVDDLTNERHWVTHRDGRRFRVYRGEPFAPGPIVAYYRDDGDMPVFLESVR